MNRSGWLAVISLVMVGAFAACGADPAPSADVLTEPLLRELLPDAASVDLEALDALARLGIRTTPDDVGHDVALPEQGLRLVRQDGRWQVAAFHPPPPPCR